MRIIKSADIKKAVIQVLIKANLILREDVLSSLKSALKKEKNKRARYILRAIIENARIAKKEKLPICQDTGMPVVFLEIGQNVKIEGGNPEDIINEAIAEGTEKGFLRKSIVEPLFNRRYVKSKTCIIHTRIVGGKRLKITVLPKGFGCENKTTLKMFKPTADLSVIEDFIVESVKNAGPDACPPFVVGVGIGGTADYACLLAKKALLRKITNYQLPVTNYVSKLERDLLKKINKLNIGPMGLGGRTTCLGIHILTHPTHIAGLPVCVNINCHALRSATIVL